jgi:hypothetical protein
MNRAKRLAWSRPTAVTLADRRRRSDKGEILDGDVAVAIDPRRESRVIADHRVMLDIGINVGVK